MDIFEHTDPKQKWEEINPDDIGNSEEHVRVISDEEMKQLEKAIDKIIKENKNDTKF